MAIEDHPRFNTIRAFVTSVIKTVEIRQAQYFTKNKKYFQGIKIPALELSGDEDIEPGFSMRPGDQEESWNDFATDHFRPGLKFPVEVSIDVYEHPETGWGYIINFSLVKAGLGPDKYGRDGDRWKYRYNSGTQQLSGVWDDWYIEVIDE